MFACKLCNIFKNTLFTEYLWPNASVAAVTFGKFSGNKCRGIIFFTDGKFTKVGSSFRNLLSNFASHIKGFNKLYQINKRQSCHNIETRQLICSTNQSAGFYMIANLAFSELIVKNFCNDDFQKF